MGAVIVRQQPSFPMGWQAGLVYMHRDAVAGTTLLGIENRLMFYPIFAPHGARIDRIGLNISTGAADATCQAQLGVYSNVNGRPSALLLDGGKVTVGTGTGDFTVTVATSLQPGWNFLCCISNRNGGAGAMPTFRAANATDSSLLAEYYGQSGYQYNVNATSGMYADVVPGTWGTYVLPSTAPSVTLSATAGLIALGVRAA